MKKIFRAALLLVLIFIALSSVGAQELRTSLYTSRWGDFKTVVPDGWKATSDAEETHYTNVHFKGQDPYYVLSIRWYTRYATHRQVSGLLEMYSGPDEFVQQFSRWYGQGNLIEQPHEINMGERKAKRFVGRLGRLPQGELEYKVLARREKLGGRWLGTTKQGAVAGRSGPLCPPPPVFTCLRTLRQR